MNKQRSKSKHPARVKNYHKFIWLTVILASLVTLVIALWVLPSQPDPERVKFKTLRDDIIHITHTTKDIVHWIEIKSQCSYGGAIGLQKGGWGCEVIAHGKYIKSNTQSKLKQRLTEFGKFDETTQYATVSEMRHNVSGIRCTFDSKSQDVVVMVCGDTSSKSWYPPDSGSTGDSLPGAGAWKRLDR